MTRELKYQAADEEATRRLGGALARALPDGSVVALIGPLGAGKTRLVQAVAAASGVDPREVVSPTFVVIHEYQGQRPIYHFDVYRLREDTEFLDLGPDEYFDAGGITFIEWGDRVARLLPEDRIEITIELAGETVRDFFIRGLGPNQAAFIEALAKELDA